jgi:hypothetical protein
MAFGLEGEADGFRVSDRGNLRRVTGSFVSWQGPPQTKSSMRVSRSQLVTSPSPFFSDSLSLFLFLFLSISLSLSLAQLSFPTFD